MNRPAPHDSGPEPFYGHDEDAQLCEERAEGRRIRETALDQWRQVWRRAEPEGEL